MVIIISWCFGDGIKTYKWPQWLQGSRTHLYIIERDFYGEFETLHVLVYIEDVSKYETLETWLYIV